MNALAPAPTARTDDSSLPWDVFICKACGLLYDEGKGDEDSGLAPGTRFADIPDDWACPLCGVTKADFEPYVMAAIARTTRRSAASTGRRAALRHEPGAVIVGGGRAGWQMAQALRERDPLMSITIVTSCAGDVYDKPLLSVALARGITPEKLPREAGRDAALRLNVKLLAYTHAIRVSPTSCTLRTSRGVLPYRHLVLAHGAEARQVPHMNPALCWHINHLHAYTRFRQALGGCAQRIAVVGAGLIGSELANDLALAGHQITLLDIAERPLSATVSEAQSQQLLDAWKSLSLAFVGGVQVSEVSALPPSHEKLLVTQCGKSFAVDHIVVAAGLTTPNRLALSAGLSWNNGVDVQPETLFTNVQGIHALGDCISIAGQLSRYIEPIGRQAQTVAATIVGAPPVFYRQLRVPLRIKTSSMPFTI